MNSLLSGPIHITKRVFAKSGFAVVRLNQRFGIDVIADIKRLAGVWDYPLRTAFDVGANNGGTARELLERLPEARIFSFEPDPRTFAALVERIGPHPRFHPENVALSSQSGNAEMVEYGDASQINSLTPDSQHALRFGLKGRTISVRTTTGDAFCAENYIDTLDLLKIDTEGFDLVVLESFRSMLERRAIGFVYVEYNDLQSKQGAFGGALLPFDTLLRQFGYRFIASYNDHIHTGGEVFSVSNALFARLPD